MPACNPAAAVLCHSGVAHLSQGFMGNLCGRHFEIRKGQENLLENLAKMLRCAARRLVSPYLRGASSSLVVASRKMSSKPKETDEAFDARWKAYFERPDIDAWELRNGLNELYGKDLVPEPKILIAMLHACRRLNDYPMTVRILEAVKSKSAGSSEIYNYILTELKPTMDELGLSTPEELGLA